MSLTLDGAVESRTAQLFYSSEHKLFLLTGQPRNGSYRRAFVTLLPEHQMPAENRAAMHSRATAYNPRVARVTLVANPRTKKLEAHDHVTRTQSEIEANRLELMVAMNLMTSRGDELDRNAYTRNMAIVHARDVPYRLDGV